MRYKTIVEIITDGDDADEALDRAGEYLRGTYTPDVPLKVKVQSLNKRNYRALGYTILMCLVVLSLSLGWFAAGRTYQKIASSKQKTVETYAVHPPLKTDTTQNAGKEFKKSWDKLYREKVLYNADKNINSK